MTDPKLSQPGAVGLIASNWVESDVRREEIALDRGTLYIEGRMVRAFVAGAELLSAKDSEITELHNESREALGIHNREIAIYQAKLSAAEAELARVRGDAESWRSLMHCRMRTVGTSGINDPSNNAYMTLELWVNHPDPTDQQWFAGQFDKFMAKARYVYVRDTALSTDGGAQR